MHETCLIGHYNPDDVLAWEQGLSRTAGQFLADVFSLADSLPDRPTALNLATNRYAFLVGFAAAIMREQVTLLPQSRAPQALSRIADDFPGSYALTDRDEAVEGIDSVSIRLQPDQTSLTAHIPRVPLCQ